MRVEHAIDIDAPSEVVWRVTADVERWPEWTPTVTAVHRLDSEPFGRGSVARIKQPAQPAADWLVTAFDSGRMFTWESRRRGLRFVGTHEVSPRGGGTRNLLRVEAEGILAFLLWPVLKPAMQRALAAENRGLKQEAERVAGSLAA